MSSKLFKKKIKADGSKGSEYIHKDILLRVFSDLIEGKATKLNSSDTLCNEVIEKWNEMLDVLKDTGRSTILDINTVLQNITRMDSLRDMQKSVITQTEDLHSMSASSEELSASIEDVSNMSQKVSENSVEARRVTEIGIKNISNSIEFVKKSFEDITDIDKQMQQVKEKTKRINEIIDIVKGIADQTNLLALNAAIEAARAGDQGKGFAVVADEVKKLAQHTKNSVTDIQENIISLQKDIDNSVLKINGTTQQLDEGKQIVDEALKSIKSIDESISVVNDTIIQVAANTEEQNAVTQSFTGSIMELSKHADYIDNSCKSTGEIIYELSKKIDAIRLEAVKRRLYLSDEDMVEIYKTDHLLWRWRVYNMLLGNDTVDINVVGDYKSCRLGKWYYGIECDRFRDNKVFMELEKPHMELHEIAKKAVIAFGNNDIKAAEEGLKKMDECSVQVFRVLDKLKDLM